MLANASIRSKIMLALGLILLALAVVVAGSLLLLAEQQSDGLVINIAGRQRMLSQKMTKEALLLGREGVDPDQAAGQLAATAELFDRSLAGLLDGDPKQGLPPTAEPEIRAQIDKIRSIWLPLRQAGRDLAEDRGRGERSRAALRLLVSNNSVLLAEMNRAVDMYADGAEAKVRLLKVVLLGGLVFGLAVFGFTFWWVNGNMIRPLRQEVDNLGRLSAGDLRPLEASAPRSDEIGRVAGALEALRLAWNDNVLEIRGDAGQVSQSAAQIAVGNQDLSDRTQQQASAIQETASAIEQMTGSVKQNARNSQEANRLVKQTSQMAGEGGKVIDKTVAAMAAVRESSKRIADIIGVVKEIAFQTNLLALNAAVEAARAGEAGRGFAVVAGEVRGLAQRAAAASKEIQGLITDSVAKVQQGNDLVNESGRLLADIIGNVQQVDDTMSEINASSQEQAQGIDDINRAVSLMDEAVQQNAALVEQVASAADNLATVARQMSERLETFKVD